MVLILLNNSGGAVTVAQSLEHSILISGGSNRVIDNFR